ncbi:MAG: hypothetical protein HQL29_02495 [Candidatus Omnitrophica bacterium]|nr:hypothetical protein [Candidatus Omnitrophota bacterium]
MGSGSIDSYSSVPSDSGSYSTSIPKGSYIKLATGNVYAFKTSSVYGLIKITSLSPTRTGDDESAIDISFDYKVQMSGNNNF